MSEWSKWRDIGQCDEDPNCTKHGIYQIRIATPDGKPIPIPRIADDDANGIYYIGRTGESTRKTARNFSQRLREFHYGAHSGGNMYDLVEPVLRSKPGLENFTFQYRTLKVEDENIKTAEALHIRMYIEKFGELPPGNRSIPKDSRVQGLLDAKR